MSVEAVWDLQAKNQAPRCLAVYPVVQPSSGVAKNPFDTQPPPQQDAGVVAVVFGTDRGSFHYRTYATGPQTRMSSSGSTRGGGGGGPLSTSQQGGVGGGIGITHQQQQQQPLQPLGRKKGSSSSSSSQSASSIPRHFYPMDLGTLPGPVVQCLALPSRQQQTFLILIDDGGRVRQQQQQQQAISANAASVTYAALLVASSVTTPGFQVLSSSLQPHQQSHHRMSCATTAAGHNIIIYGVGRTLRTLSPELWGGGGGGGSKSSSRLDFSGTLLPAPGVRSGPDALIVTAQNRVAVTAVGNSFYAVAASDGDTNTADGGSSSSSSSSLLKLLSFQQSSQVHPAIVLDLQDKSLDAHWSSLFLASGRECAVVDLYSAPDNYGHVLNCSKPRNGTVTVQSPILAAAASWPWVAVLQSDGLISIRSPSCLAIALRTVEVGQRPNDYFVLRTVSSSTTANSSNKATSGNSSKNSSHIDAPWMVTAAYSGECKVLQCHPDTSQDLADRLMRHAIDSFGPTGFPRQELAEAVGASFTATSYTGPEPSPAARTLLKQYLEAVLGLADFESGGSSGWPTELSAGHHSAEAVHHGTFADQAFSGRGGAPSVVSLSQSPAVLLTGSALLCLVCSQLSPPDPVLASRAAKSVSEKMGVVLEQSSSISKQTVAVCELVAEKLLREASSTFSLVTGSSPAPITRAHQRSSHSSTVEAAIYLLRACGKHERAIDVAYERLQQQAESSSVENNGSSGTSSTTVRGFWSQIKYESYTATHLSDIWGARKEEGCRLVLSSPATHRLLESNPRLGLSVFTAMHPQNEAQWRDMVARDDPLANPDRVYEVLKLLKSIQPSIPCDQERSYVSDGDYSALPLESGRALAVSYLRSAIGISTGRPADEDDELFGTLPVDADLEEHLANFHDELSFLLLEGVIAERPGDDSNSVDTELGMIYRSMLRELLKWPLAKIRPEQFMESLPPTFLQEKALVLGRLNRHEDALRILYRDLQSLDLALEYCDDRYAQQKAQQEYKRARQQNNNSMYADNNDFHVKEEDNAYLPLVRVALESSEDTDRGTATAIKVLALRRGAIDRAAALRLLPSDVPVSAVARPFLIPALVDSESQVRRMTMVSALLRSRFLRLKDKLTAAQLKAQANIYVVPALKSLNLGDPLHSTKSFRARTVSPTPGSTMPYIEIVKHFFPRHLVIQAKVTNLPYSTSNPSAAASSLTFGDNNSNKQPQPLLSDIAFVVAESSEEEAIQPLLQIPIQVLPPRRTGSAWCVLQAAPNLMDGPTAQLTCELRYAVQQADAPLGLHHALAQARTYVEELQDIEVQAAYFS